MGFGSTTFGGPGDGSSSTDGTLVSDLIYHGLRLAGIALAPERIPSSPMYGDGLRALNRMLGNWSTQRSNIFNLNIDQWTVVANTQSYTIGPGGDFDTARPQRIPMANLILQTTPTDVRRPMALLTDAQWASKRVQQIFSMPLEIYNDSDAPLSKLYFWPIPDQTYQIELYTWQALTKAVSINDTLSYPDGYEEAIVYGVAKRLMPMFRDRRRSAEEDALVVQQAAASLSAIQSLNSPAPQMRTDEALTGRGGFYNYSTGLVED